MSELPEIEIINNNLIDILSRINGIQTVTSESGTPGIDDILEKLEQTPQTSFPSINVYSDLPKPNNDLTIGWDNENADLTFDSELPIVLLFLAYEPNDRITKTRTWCNLVWKTIAEHKKLDRPESVYKFDISADEIREIQKPYIGFFVYITVNYIHERGI